MSEKGKTLTPKQQKFVDLYEGNATAAARQAGYSDPAYGRQLITKTNVQDAIEKRVVAERNERIASRQERQEWWTAVVRGQALTVIIAKDGTVVALPPSMKDRLKASQLLGKSEGDFIVRKDVQERPQIIFRMIAPDSDR